MVTRPVAAGAMLFLQPLGIPGRIEPYRRAKKNNTVHVCDIIAVAFCLQIGKAILEIEASCDGRFSWGMQSS